MHPCLQIYSRSDIKGPQWLAQVVAYFPALTHLDGSRISLPATRALPTASCTATLRKLVLCNQSMDSRSFMYMDAGQTRPVPPKTELAHLAHCQPCRRWS